MTLKEIAKDYADSAALLKKRLAELRRAVQDSDDPEEIWHLKRRIAELTPMLTECYALAKLCEHYYDRGFWHQESYSFSAGRVRKPRGQQSGNDSAYTESGRE